MPAPPAGAETAPADRLPDELPQWPTYVPAPRVLADAELLARGALPGLPGFLGAADAASVRERGALADGTPWPVPVQCVVPGELAERATAAGRLVLTDAESVPRAVVEVRAADPAPHGVALSGPVSALRPAGAYASLRLAPAQVRAALPGGRVLAVVLDRPLLAPLAARLESDAAELDAAVLLLVQVADSGAGGLPPALLVALVEAEAADLRERGLDVSVLAVPLAHHDTAADDTALGAHVASAYGATHLLAADALPGAPLAVLTRPEVSGPAAGLRALLDDPEGLPDGAALPGVAEALRRWRPVPARRGVTLLFTGLSGSGKSTVARAVAARVEARGRRVTLLDGDEVRQVLSSGLTFSRADRDLNIRRIGWVAAEVTRHGGVAVAAPIAPYADTRAEVRAMVEQHGDLVLVHVSTPLEECERRDRKGLYAKARAGLIPEFTGVSDPYEAPDDADLVLDTSRITVDEARDRVLSLLTTRGYLPLTTPED